MTGIDTVAKGGALVHLRIGSEVKSYQLEYMSRVLFTRRGTELLARPKAMNLKPPALSSADGAKEVVLRKQPASLEATSSLELPRGQTEMSGNGSRLVMCS